MGVVRVRDWKAGFQTTLSHDKVVSRCAQFPALPGLSGQGSGPVKPGVTPPLCSALRW